MDRHADEVRSISSTVKAFYQRNEPYRIWHGATNCTRPTNHDGPMVDVSGLCNVLEVNKTTMTATLEPNVPMDKLVEATLEMGLIPPVVMEFPGITAGGGFAGTAGESSSFRHGFFQDTVKEIELVLGNGHVVRASRTQRADLFRGAGGALGTMGIITLLEVRLVAAKMYVKTTYHGARSVEEAIAIIRRQTGDQATNDFVDGILFSPGHGVVITGQLCDEKPASEPIRRFSGRWDPWFYLHARDRTRKESHASSHLIDYIPLPEYLFRYDRAAFWVARHGFKYFGFVPFNRLTRWLLDDLLHTRMLYRALHASGESHRFVLQDIALPYSTAPDFVRYTSEKLDIWPLWLCPLRRPEAPTFHPFTTTPGPSRSETDETDETDETEMLNVGVWGRGPAEMDAFVSKNRELENCVRQLGGMKWLYAHTYYDEDEFWKLYGRQWYDDLRQNYHAATLPTVYDKARIDLERRKKELRTWRHLVKTHWPVGGIWGVWKSLRSGDYRLHRDASWKGDLILPCNDKVEPASDPSREATKNSFVTGS